MPIQNMARQARFAGSQENNATENIAAMPQPMAHPPCTVPTALPRCSARIVSPINTEPTAHSPPKPRPWHPRVKSNCQKLLVNPLRKVKSANQRMVNCKTWVRPKRSASNPASQPPMADMSKAGCSQHACFSFADMPRGDQDRDYEAVDHHVHAVQGPASEGCYEGASL